MAAPATVTITLQDGSTTVALAIPPAVTASQFIKGMQVAGGFWDTATSTPDTVTGGTWWPWSYVKKAVTS